MFGGIESNVPALTDKGDHGKPSMKGTTTSLRCETTRKALNEKKPTNLSHGDVKRGTSEQSSTKQRHGIREWQSDWHSNVSSEDRGRGLSFE